ncbi:MAG: sugar phosphate isomerase/epimerase family protein [Thermodesulfobacteriota bacterium]
MRFAFSSNAFLRFDLLEAIRIIAEAGYDGIEIMADVPHAYPLHLTDADILKIRKALVEARIAVSNINAFMHHADGDTYHPSWIEKDPVLRLKRVDYTLHCLDLAEKLGARNISTEPGGPLDGMSREEGLHLFRQGLAAVEDRARERGVRILIEPEPGLLIENSRQFLELFRDLDSAVFGINFDIGHFYCVAEDPSELIPDMKEMIHHFHIEDIAASREHHHLMLGDGAIDLPRVLRAIEGIGYRGYVTVELYTYEHVAVQAVRNAFDYLAAWRAHR